MSGYIITPVFFYLIDVAECIKFTSLIASAVLGVFAIFILLPACFEYYDSCRDAEDVIKKWTKVLKPIIGVVVVFAVIGFLVPSKSTLLSMQISKFATYENAELTLDSIKSAVDYIVEAMK